MIAPQTKRKHRAGNPKVAVGYVRVSTGDQNLGPDVQRMRIEAWAKRTGTRLVGLYEDHGVSGTTLVTERPGLLAALAAVEENRAGVLVAMQRDRFARGMAVAGALEWAAKDIGAVLVTVDHGADDGADEVAVLVRKTMDDMMAQIESMRARQRTKAALAVKRARGERTGSVPYGCKLAADGVHLVPVAAEVTVIETAIALHAAGLSLRAVSGALAERGMTARSGAPFSACQVRNMLMRANALRPTPARAL